jgi:hypothetical protein
LAITRHAHRGDDVKTSGEMVVSKVKNTQCFWKLRDRNETVHSPEKPRKLTPLPWNSGLQMVFI